MTFLIFTFAGYLCGNLNRQTTPERVRLLCQNHAAKDPAFPALNDKRSPGHATAHENAAEIT